ncbi:MAG: hypothetical protein HXY46_03330 [Syntrophaceae bacterium]|nr:hypothetical protein [Syntrophaceae bacterium]
MREQLNDLIEKSMTMEAEIRELLAIKVAMIPRWFLKQYIKGEMLMTEEEQKELREKCQKFGGMKTVNERYDSLKKDFDEKASLLAEILEEEDFIIEQFRTDLKEENFSWLNNHIGQIKQRLKGIEVF